MNDVPRDAPSRIPYWKEASRELHARLEPAEEVVAEGRQWGSSCYVVVTPQRLLIHGDDEAIRFDDIEYFAERLDTHRYFLVLHHAPLTRWRYRRRWKVGFLLLGPNRSRAGLETDTLLRFSRRDTSAAIAIRDQLERRRIQAAEWREPPESGSPPPLFTFGRRPG